MARQNATIATINNGLLFGVGLTIGTLLVKASLAYVDKFTGWVPDEIDYKSGYAGATANSNYAGATSYIPPVHTLVQKQSRVVYTDDPVSYAQSLYGPDPDRASYQGSYVGDTSMTDSDFQ